VWRFSADVQNQDAATQGKRYSTGSTDGIVNAWDTGSGKVYAVSHGSERASAWPGDYSDMLIYTGKLFPAHYRGGAFVATAGSGSRAPGHRVDFVLFADGRPAGDPESFADGFARADGLHTSGDLRDRPIGLALGADGSLYVSDADYGRIWRIFYRR
jgi:glucose/arabinose dehydrogenase